MPCKWGNKTDTLRNSSAWACMYKIPLSLVVRILSINYGLMQINECLCTPDKCRCYEEKDIS